MWKPECVYCGKAVDTTKWYAATIEKTAAERTDGDPSWQYAHIECLPDPRVAPVGGVRSGR
jgi:hypothetical protein